MQPISEETQLLLTVYYLVQLGEPGSSCGLGWFLPGGPARLRRPERDLKTRLALTFPGRGSTNRRV